MTSLVLLVAGLLITALAVVLVFRKKRIADITICFSVAIVFILLGLPSRGFLKNVHLPGGLNIDFYPASPSQSPTGNSGTAGAAVGAAPNLSQSLPGTSAIAGAGAKDAASASHDSAKPSHPTGDESRTAGIAKAAVTPQQSPSGPSANMPQQSPDKPEQDWRLALKTRGFTPLILPDDEELGPGSVVRSRFDDLPDNVRARTGGAIDLDKDMGATDVFANLKISDQVVDGLVPGTLSFYGIPVDCSTPHIRSTTAFDLKSAVTRKFVEALESQGERGEVHVVLSSFSCTSKGRPVTIAVKLADFSIKAEASR